MCGRYTVSTPPDELHEFFDVHGTPADYELRYNVAPTQEAPVIRQVDERRGLDRLRWGLVPGAARDLTQRARRINARIETVAERRAYAESFRYKRCLVPADGFYEWRRAGREKLPIYFHLPERPPFAFAGLWARWQPLHGEAYESFTILTTAANETVSAVHDRMPVILAPDAFGPWLDAEIDDPEAAHEILKLHLNEEITSYPVSTLVNQVANDSAECIAPGVHEPARQASLF